MLYLGSRRGLQIIVLSCNPREYATFAAKRVDLQRPRDAGSFTPAASGATLGADDAGAADDTAYTDDSGEPALATGKVPSRDDAPLVAAFLLDVGLMPDQKADNTSRRTQLGWHERTSENIKDQLVTTGRIETGRGRSGSVRLTEGDHFLT